MKNLALCFFNVLFMASGQLAFKYGMKDKVINSVADIIRAMFSPIVFSGLILYIFAAMLWLYILSKLPISVAYPIQALAFPIVLILSTLIFKESITVTRWVGILIIVIGIFFTSM